MGKMDPDKLQRLLDYHLKQDEPAQRLETQRLLAEDAELQELDQVLVRSFEALGSLGEEEPPAGLTDRTLQKIAQHRQVQQLAKSAADVASGGLKRDRTSRARWVLSNLRDAIAVAACLTLVFLFMRPGLQKARHMSQEQACANQFRSIGYGLSQYAHDYRGRMPYVLRPQGAKWLGVGEQDDQHYSNTRNTYLLVKMGYVSVDKFLCPGADAKKNVKLRVKMNPQTLKTLQDFTDQHQVNYSFFLILNNQSFFAKQSENIPIGSDQNPLFVDYDSHKQTILDLSVNQELQSQNSPNHGGRGQNLLYGDGHVRFSTTRLVGLNDDIFTLNDVLQYDGDEQPSTESDILHAP